MLLIHSMNEATVLAVVSVCLLMLVALRKNPIAILGVFFREFMTNRKFMFHFLLVIGLMYFNKMELLLESRIKSQADFTGDIYALEGNFVATFQRLFHNDTLTLFSTFFYVVIFTALMAASIGIYTYGKNLKLFYALSYGLMINYIVAIPFYLFFPVNEVWSFHPDVHFLMKDIFPSFEAEYRPLSGLNNCFPSLHTSISVTLAVIASRSGIKFWRWFTRLSAAFIIFSIFYLGIHWLTDMCGGLVLGVFAGRAALRISEGRRAVHAAIGTRVEKVRP
jgi:membrane-associated phospholipid phosphatase